MSDIGAVTPAQLLPTVTGPVTGPGPMFLRSFQPGVPGSIDLAEHDYVEEEFFLDGLAHVYGYGEDDSVVVERSSVPYRTRLIVRRPADGTTFNGVVQFESLHPGATYDRVLTFAETWRHLLRTRSAWVGVSCKPNAIANLGVFNPDRYGDLRMNDRSQLWDLLAQVGLLLKQPGSSGLLGGAQAEWVYASGWSMTGSFLRTFIADGFHARAARAVGVDPFDGYVVGISSGQFVYGYTPLNDERGPDIDTLENQGRRATVPVGDPRRIMQPPGVPVIELMSEAEALNNLTSRRPDSDVAQDRFRLYEVPGRGHRGAGSDEFSALSDVEMRAAGIEQVPHPGVTDIDGRPRGGYPHHLVTHAVFENLHRWAAEGVSPPRADPIVLLREQPARALSDADGNAVGGLRSPFVDVPLARYASTNPEDPLCSGPVTPWVETPFPPDVLEQRYGSRESYLAAFGQAVQAAVAQRRLCADDADDALAWADRISRERWDAAGAPGGRSLDAAARG